LKLNRFADGEKDMAVLLDEFDEMKKISGQHEEELKQEIENLKLSADHKIMELRRELTDLKRFAGTKDYRERML
jgi:hypothetical protein